jgi:hypothetical protein
MAKKKYKDYFSYANGGKVEEFNARNLDVLKAGLDSALSTVNLHGIYNPEYQTEFGQKVGDMSEKHLQPVGAGVSRVAMDIAAPGVGTAVHTAGGAITKSVNSKDIKEEVLPNTQYALPYGYEDGGEVDSTIINIERDELEVKNGKVVRDFKNKPPHPEAGLDPRGNVVAEIGNVIIPADMREKYLKGSSIERRTIERNLSNKNNGMKKAEGGGIFPDQEQAVLNEYNLWLKQNYPQQYKTNQWGNPDRYREQYYNHLMTNNKPETAGAFKTIKPYGNVQPVPMSTNPYVLGGNQPAPKVTDLSGLGGTAGSMDPMGSTAGPATVGGGSKRSIGSYAAPFIDNIANGVLTAFTPKIPKPEYVDNVNLDKRLNIQPALTNVDVERKSALGDVANRTASGSVYRAAASNIYAKGQGMKNQLYGQAAQHASNMTNQEIMTNLDIERGNKAVRNDYEMKKILRKDDIHKRISDNFVNASMDIQGMQFDKNMTNADVEKIRILSKVMDPEMFKRNFPQYSYLLK